MLEGAPSSEGLNNKTLPPEGRGGSEGSSVEFEMHSEAECSLEVTSSESKENDQTNCSETIQETGH